MATQSTEGLERPADRVTDPRAEIAFDDVRSSFDDGVRDKRLPVVLSTWQKVKQHFRRLWWIYLIAVIILLAILLPVM